MLTDREKTWKTAFKVMFALLEDWKNNDPDLCRRLPTRIFYEAVGNAKTGYTSKAAADNLSESTDDHFAMPQWLGRFVMDNGDVYLTDFQKFKKTNLIRKVMLLNFLQNVRKEVFSTNFFIFSF